MSNKISSPCNAIDLIIHGDGYDTIYHFRDFEMDMGERVTLPWNGVKGINKIQRKVNIKATIDLIECNTKKWWQFWKWF